MHFEGIPADPHDQHFEECSGDPFSRFFRVTPVYSSLAKPGHARITPKHLRAAACCVDRAMALGWSRADEENAHREKAKHQERITGICVQPIVGDEERVLRAMVEEERKKGGLQG